MPIETYRLEVREDDGVGIEATVYDEDDLVEATTHVPFDAHDLEPADGRDEPSPLIREVTTDVTTVDLQYERDDDGFTVRLLGDREELASERIADDAWGITRR